MPGELSKWAKVSWARGLPLHEQVLDGRLSICLGREAAIRVGRGCAWTGVWKLDSITCDGLDLTCQTRWIKRELSDTSRHAKSLYTKMPEPSPTERFRRLVLSA